MNEGATTHDERASLYLIKSIIGKKSRGRELQNERPHGGLTDELLSFDGISFPDRGN